MWNINYLMANVSMINESQALTCSLQQRALQIFLRQHSLTLTKFKLVHIYLFGRYLPVFDGVRPRNGLWHSKRKWTFRLLGFSIRTDAVITTAMAMEAVRTVRQEVPMWGCEVMEWGCVIEVGRRVARSSSNKWAWWRIFGIQLDVVFVDNIWN